MHDTQFKERKRVGEIFKNKREEMHLSLKEVENATSIRMMYLQAIEEGHIDKFSAQFSPDRRVPSAAFHSPVREPGLHWPRPEFRTQTSGLSNSGSSPPLTR